jgi:MFS family permease
LSSASLRDPLRRRSFRHLAIASGINSLGDELGLVALSVLVFAETGSALASTLLFIGTGVVPALLAPVLVPTFEPPAPRLVIPGIYATEAVAFAVLALLAHSFSLAAVVAVAAGDAALALTARSLTRGVTAALLSPHGELRSGNAVLNIAFTVGTAIGPALAGLVVAGVGVQTSLLLDAASFCVIAVLVSTGGALPRSAAEPGRLLASIKAGWVHIRDNPTLKRLIGAQAFALVFFTLTTPVEVIYVKETLGAGDLGYGLLLTAWGAGMVGGSTMFAVLRGASLPILLLCSTIAMGASYLGMAAAPTLVVACVAAVPGGIGNGVQWVAAISAVQELAAPSMQVRTIGTLESIAKFSPAIGFLAGGVLTSLWDPRLTFVVAGLGVLAVVAVAVPQLIGRWPERSPLQGGFPLDESDVVVLELLPGGMPIPNSEVEL